MAHHSATQKSIKQIKTRTTRNTDRRSQVKTAVKKVVAAVEANNATEAQAALIKAQSSIFTAVSKGVIKKETASRKFSRLNATVKAISAKK